MFSTRLNHYLEERNCSGKTLSSITGISAATISRYRSGKTVPSIESGIIENISSALASLPGGSTGKEEILEDLLVAAYEDHELVDYKVFSEKLSLLIKTLEITKSKLSDAIHINSSYLSKICNGQVNPRNPIYIAESISEYIVAHYSAENHRAKVRRLIWKDKGDSGILTSDAVYYQSIRKWLLVGENARSLLVDTLLHQFGEYNIATYLPYFTDKRDATDRSVLSVPKEDFQVFLGSEGLRKACYAWLECTCASSVNDEVFIFDEVCSEHARRTPEQTKEYAAGMERLIQSGKKITIVNNLQNDLDLVTRKMIIWLPLTMSLRVENHYLNEPSANICKNTLLVSSNAVLIGNVYGDDYDNASFTLVRSPQEILTGRKKAKAILDHSELSNHVYLEEEKFTADLMSVADCLSMDEPIYFYFPVPPLATMSEELLRKILKRNSVSSELCIHLLDRFKKECRSKERLVQRYLLEVHVDYIEESNFAEAPVYIALNDFETNLKLTYTYEEYLQHITDLKDYAAKNEHIRLTLEHANSFKNMNIIIIPGKFAGSTPLVDQPIYTSSTKKPIIDSITHILYIISPKNRQEVLKDERLREILFFYKGLTSI